MPGGTNARQSRADDNDIKVLHRSKIPLTSHLSPLTFHEYLRQAPHRRSHAPPSAPRAHRGCYLAACRPGPLPAPPPGLEWSNDTIQRVVNAVRAGRSLQPRQWPEGARVAVLLSFDVDNETIALRTGEPTVGALSQGEYGARVALRRVVELMDRHSIPASFFIPAVSLMLHPEMAEVIKKSGRHEFGVHGWIHETNTLLPAAVERDLVKRALDYLTQVTGSRPVGYRAPSWNFSPNTLSIIRELGFTYESSMMSDDRPYELLQNGQPTGMVEIPVEWILDDAPRSEEHTSELQSR